MAKTIVVDFNDTASDICMLLGHQGRHWEFYETDRGRWTLRLWTRRN